MKAEMERLDKSRVRLKIEVDAQKLEEALQVAYRKVVKKVTVPGFRKGRVPRVILERNYGKEILFEDAVEHILPQAYSAAVEETGIQPVDQPDIDVDRLVPGEGMSFTAEVDVFPEVNLGEYKGIEAEKEKVTVTDQDVDDALSELRERSAELVAVDSRDQVQNGDFATIDFTGYIDGEPFSGGAAEDYVLEVGSNTFIPGFEEQLVGMKVGEERDITVTFPEDYSSKELAGKEAVFKVKVKTLKEKLLPELDDEFAKDVSSEVETLAELRTQIREDLEKREQNRTKSKLENTLIEKIIENSEMEIPESMIERQLNATIEEFSRNLLYQGMNLEQYLRMANMSREQLRERLRPEAEKGVKRDLVIDAIADKEGIEVSEEEINNRIDEMVAEHPQPEKVRQMWESRKENISHALRVEKTLQFIVDSAQITEVEAEAEPKANSAATAE